MSTIIDPIMEPFVDEQSSKVFQRNIGIADCECQFHKRNHTRPGFCGKQAKFKMSAKNEFDLTPALVFLLCEKCLIPKEEYIKNTFPNMIITIDSI